MPTHEAREIARGLPKQARRRLMHYECGLCGIRLHRGHCSAIYGQCTTELMVSRMANCLAQSRIPAVRAVAAALREGGDTA